MNAKLVLHQLQRKLQVDGHITPEDVKQAGAAVKSLGGHENMALYSLLKRRMEVQHAESPGEVPENTN